MDKTSSSIPPIILLQFLHMAFPQFAEKGEQGQYLQQVKSDMSFSSCNNLHYLCVFMCKCGCIHVTVCIWWSDDNFWCWSLISNLRWPLLFFYCVLQVSWHTGCWGVSLMVALEFQCSSYRSDFDMGSGHSNSGPMLGQQGFSSLSCLSNPGFLYSV